MLSRPDVAAVTIARPMASNPPQISPDGRYWWDGQAWQPMPSSTVPQPLVEPAQAERPSWLAAGVEIPGEPAPAPPPTPEWSAPVAPAWAPSTPPASTSRNTIMIAAAGVLVVLMAGVGFVALRQSFGQNDAGTTASATSPEAASPSTPTASAAAA